jgi:excisionase family DNA binding protein
LVTVYGSLSKKIALVRKPKEEKAEMLADAKVLTVSELSEYLRVHRSTIYRLLKKGQLPGFKIGSDWRFNVEAIDQWRMQQGAAQLEELRNAAGN